jgi:hypothetical protein
MRRASRDRALAAAVLAGVLSLGVSRGARGDAPTTGNPAPPAAGAPSAEAAEPGQDTDPTKPVLFSLRDEHYNIQGGNWINAFIFRKDELTFKKATLPGQARGLLLRMELPVTTSYLGGDKNTGLGDGYVQVLLLPQLGGHFLLGIGSGLLIPTATDRKLGTGKWTIAPVVAPVWFLPRQGYAFVKFQEFESFAGPSSRPDISYLLITPTVLWRVSRRNWVLVDSESRTSWTQGFTSYRSGLLLGTMLTTRSGLSLKVEVPWGNHRLGDLTLKAVFYLTRF